MPDFLFPLIAFAAGSVPFGLLVGLARGVDIRQRGSGNIGATNVFRVVGAFWGVLVFLFDFLKGVGPVVLLRIYGPEGAAEGVWGVATALGAILGHNYSPWIGFKGGKGVATSAGALLALFPWALLAGVVVWVVVLKVTRYVSVASMTAAVAVPVAVAVQAQVTGDWRASHLGFALLIALLSVWRHRSNIRNLRAGREHRIGRDAPEPRL